LLCSVSESGQILQGVLCGEREAAQLAYHEIDDVVGVAPRSDRREVPVPSASVSLEGDQIVLDQLLQELIREERIAGGLLVHELREWPRSLGRTMKRVREPPGQIFIVERTKHDVRHRRTLVTDSRARPLERVRRGA